MWLFLFAGSATLLAIAGFFRLVTYISKESNDVTPSDVASAIERHLEGAEGPWDWDTFTSVPLANEKLDAIRLRCIELDSPLPISAEKREELERIVQRLKSEAFSSTT